MSRVPPFESESTDPVVRLADSAKRTAAASYLDVRYDLQRKPYTHYPAQLCKYLYEKHLRDPSFRMLLELGSGRGEFLYGFDLCGIGVLGLDRSLQEERRFQQPMVIADIDGKSIPLATSSVDVVFNKSVIEHIHNTDVFLSEIHRVLRPEGLLIVMTPDWKAQFRHFYDDYTHVKPFTLEGITDAIKAHRFLIRESTRFRQLPFLWNRPYLHVLSDALARLPDNFKRYKVVKSSKEWMLLVVAENGLH